MKDSKVTLIENDNLRNEYARLFEDVSDSLDFARIALQKNPDAVNFWLGMVVLVCDY